jgi:putative sporulation protein YyaC
LAKIQPRGFGEIVISAKNGPIIIDTHDDTAAQQLAAALRRLISNKQGSFDDIVFVCIGTDRATGDALGPLVGHLLTGSNATVYGNLKKPVHAVNLLQSLEKIKQYHKNPLIIAIDACLGASDKIGKLIVKEGGIMPAMAIAGTLPEVGDISIAGIVNISAGLSGQCPLAVLSSTRLSLVMQMAEVVATAIALCMKKS